MPETRCLHDDDTDDDPSPPPLNHGGCYLKLFSKRDHFDAREYLGWNPMLCDVLKFRPSQHWSTRNPIGYLHGALHVYDSICQLRKYGATLINAHSAQYQHLCVGALPAFPSFDLGDNYFLARNETYDEEADEESPEANALAYFTRDDATGGLL